MLLKIPYHKEKPGKSTEIACLHMVFEYLGRYLDSNRYLDSIDAHRKKPDKKKAIIDIATENEMFAYVHENLSLSEIKEFVQNKKPVIIDWTRFSTMDGHFVVAVGFDKENIIINDPYFGEKIEMTDDSFENVWCGGNPFAKKWICVLSESKKGLKQAHQIRGEVFRPK